MKFAGKSSFLLAALFLLVSCQLSNASDAFLDKLRRSDHLSSSEHSFILHDHPRDNLPAEKAKYEHRQDVIKLQRSQSDLTHRVVFSVQQRNLDRLEDILMDISDPRSFNYGNHLSDEEVHELTGNPQATAHIVAYLNNAQERFNANITVVKQTRRGEFITAEAPLQLWELMFRTEFHEFASVEDPELRFHRALEYFMPRELNTHVSTVFNTVQMPDLRGAIRKRMRANKRRRVPAFSAVDRTTTTSSATSTPNTTSTASSTTASPSTNTNTNTIVSANAHEHTAAAAIELLHYVTPATLNRMYSIDSNEGNHLGSQAVYETIDQTFSPSDLSIFQKQFKLPLQAVDTVIGGHAYNDACVAEDGNNCIEANLDVQYLMAVANNVPTTYYYWSGEDFLLEWIQEVSDMVSPPLVFSISYGVDEYELPDSYGREFDAVAMKLGVRGVTILASSGDDGAVSPSAADNSMRCGYSPSFPATSPYVTAVGGTMGPESRTAEVVCQSDKGGIITSGGGFSTMYSMPSWQRAQIQAYLDTVGSGSSGKGGLPGRGAPLAGFNAGGRGYPDVSALAFNYIVAVNANFTAVSGTSASSPVLAGMISLVNSARIAAGKSPVGWINPALYQLYKSFAIDITEGTNNCAAGGLVCCGHGYSALTGWDPVTGLGSVKFDAFKQAFLELGDHPLSPSAVPTALPGSPTASPSAGSSSAPTVAPSSYPSISKGWMYLQEHGAVDCEGDVTSISGVPVGVCLIQYNSQNRAVGSIQYTCDSVQATVSAYASTSCQESKLQQREYFGLGCAVSVLDSYAQDAVPYSTSLMCSERGSSSGSSGSSSGSGDLAPPVPVASVAKDYVLQSLYDSPTSCTPSLLSEYTMYLNNHCFTVADPQSGTFSFKLVYPKMYYYPSVGGCSGRATVESLNTECSSLDGRRLESSGSDYSYGNTSDSSDGSTSDSSHVRTLSDDSFDAFYEQWSKVTSTVSATTTVPTTTPTAYPSATPTSIPTSPTAIPTVTSTTLPTVVPTYTPTLKDQPTADPTTDPTAVPTYTTTTSPTYTTTTLSTALPTALPTALFTATPSVSRTQAPSAAMAQPVDVIVTIAVDQALQGIDAAGFKSGGSSSETTFKHAVAKSMSNVKSTDITIASITDDILVVSSGGGTSSKMSSAGTTTAIQPKNEYITVCVVSYTLTISTLEGGFSSADSAYILTIAQLYSAIESGSFDALLHQFAQFYHSTVLLDAKSPDSSSAISTTFTSAPVKADASKGSATTTIAIVVLVLAFALVVGVFVYAKYKGSTTGTVTGLRYNHLETDSTHGSVHNTNASGSGTIGTSTDGMTGRGGAVGTSLSRLAPNSILGRAFKGKVASAPPGPIFTIECEEEAGDEETGKKDSKSGERRKHPEQTGVELSTYNPISRETQESMSV